MELSIEGQIYNQWSWKNNLFCALCTFEVEQSDAFQYGNFRSMLMLPNFQENDIMRAGGYYGNGIPNASIALDWSSKFILARIFSRQ